MWWLVPIAIGLGVGLLISSEEKEARQNWENNYRKLELTVEEHRKNIERHLAEVRISTDFKMLTDIHYSSVKVADQAYKLLKDARISLDTVSKLLMLTKNRFNDLKIEQKSTKDKNRSYEINTEIKLLLEQRKSFFDDKDKVKNQKDQLFCEVKRLNEQTRMLKLAIRDRCSNRGQEWYQRLEERKAIKRLNY